MHGWRNDTAKDLQQVAERHGVGDLITETPRRATYRRSLQLLMHAHGALVLGVDDRGYMPSKLFNYALSGKPLLASLRQDSPAFRVFEKLPALGHALWFNEHGAMPVGEAVRVTSAFLAEAAARQHADRRAILEPYLAPAMAKRHAELFDACITDCKLVS
jgi:hypothetical protein